MLFISLGMSFCKLLPTQSKIKTFAMTNKFKNTVFLLTKHASEPESQVFLHRQQACFMSAGQPQTVLLQVSEAWAKWVLLRTQRAAHACPSSLA